LSSGFGYPGRAQNPEGLHIGVDAVLYRQTGGGVEKAVFGAVNGLCQAFSTRQHRLHVFASPDLKNTMASESNEKANFHTISHGSRLARIVREQAFALTHRQIDLWHFLGYVAPQFLPHKPVVASVYDIIALTHPHLCTRANRVFYGLALPPTLRRADRIVVPSEYVKRRIAELFPATKDRIRALPLPLPVGDPNEGIEASRGSSPERYLLAVGGLAEKKNVEFLLKAYTRLDSEIREGFPLYIAGHFAGRLLIYRKMAEELGIERNVQLLGYMPDPALRNLYKNAALLLYPSLEEGYGYPPLEAMSLGVPAIVSDRGSLPEVAGAVGAIVSPLDVATFARHITRLLTDPQEYNRVSQHGKEKTPCLTWQDYGRHLMGIYEELL